jgi:hypothetical protein
VQRLLDVTSQQKDQTLMRTKWLIFKKHGQWYILPPPDDPHAARTFTTGAQAHAAFTQG